MFITNSCNHKQAAAKVAIVGGLLIENGPPQGLRKTDSLGNSYGFTTVTSIITNKNSAPIHIEIALLNEYDYSTKYGVKKYKVILLPEELTPDTASLINPYTEEISNFLDNELYNTKYILKKSLDPNEKCVVTTGTLRPSCSTCGVIPKMLFKINNMRTFSECESSIKENPRSDTQFDIWLNIDVSGRCKIIPCGKISNLKH